jgi:hypothetical protein
MDELDEQLNRIAAQLKAQHLTFAERVPASTVAAFEAFHEVALPEAYRRFLLRFGQGGSGDRPAGNGPGPVGGLLRLQQWDALVGSEFSSGALAQEFPVDPDVEYTEENWQVLAGIDLMTRPDDEPWSTGVMAIGDHGGGIHDVLVVTGPGRGRVVYMQHDHVPYFYVHADFAAWYEAWLAANAVGRDLWNVD